MKKLAVILLAVIGVALGTNLTASAVDGYPPGTQVTVAGPTPGAPVAPGAGFNLTVGNVPPNTVLKVTFNGVTTSVTSSAAGGTMIIPLTAPATAGSFPVSVLVGTNPTPVTGSIAVATTATTTTVATTTTTVKPTNTVPVTGSSTTFTGVAIGLPLLVGGLALLVVSRRRRPIGA